MTRDEALLRAAVKEGILVPEDFPDDDDQAFRLLIRAVRADMAE